MAEPILSQVHNRSLHFIRTAREYSRIHFLFQGTVGYQGGGLFREQWGIRWGVFFREQWGIKGGCKIEFTP